MLPLSILFGQFRFFFFFTCFYCYGSYPELWVEKSGETKKSTITFEKFVTTQHRISCLITYKVIANLQVATLRIVETLYPSRMKGINKWSFEFTENKAASLPAYGKIGIRYICIVHVTNCERKFSVPIITEFLWWSDNFDIWSKYFQCRILLVKYNKIQLSLKKLVLKL